ATGRAEQEQIGALAQPAIAGRERGHLRLGDHRHGLEVEVVEGLSGGQPRLEEVALDATAAAFGDLVLGNGGEKAGRRSGRPRGRVTRRVPPTNTSRRSS